MSLTNPACDFDQSASGQFEDFQCPVLALATYGRVGGHETEI